MERRVSRIRPICLISAHVSQMRWGLLKKTLMPLNVLEMGDYIGTFEGSLSGQIRLRLKRVKSGKDNEKMKEICCKPRRVGDLIANRTMDLEGYGVGNLCVSALLICARGK